MSKTEDKSSTKNLQEKLETLLNDIFGAWGVTVATHPCKVFWFSLLGFILLSGGMAMREEFEDESLIWTPAGNPSLIADDRQKEMFPSKGGFIGAIFEVKDLENGDLVSLEAFKEIEKFQKGLFDIEGEYVNEDGETLKFKYDDICVKIGPPNAQFCLQNKSPLTFVQNQMGSLDFTKFASDKELKDQVKTGTGGNSMGNGNIIDIEQIFGGLTPETVTQDDQTGANDLEKAMSATMGFVYENGDISKEDMAKYDLMIEEYALTFNAETKQINVYLFTAGQLEEAFTSDLTSDLNLVQMSVSLVAVYCIMFMGSWSPIHFRSAAAGIALLCVGLSYASSSGLAYLVGGKSAGIHNLLPFMLIGIGVDDMFVISSAIDQTNPRDPVEVRMKHGMIHAGASISITSFTNGVAFFLGCTSSLDALSSFCFFCGLGVLMLFIASITVFSAFMVWDIKRQASKKGDCCGACCCKEDTMLCCGGRFLTPKQKAYPFAGEESDPEPEMQYANGTQKFLYERFSLAITSTMGRYIVMMVWTVYIAVSIWGATQVEIDFKNTYFISAEASINDYLDKTDNYFKSGETINVITDNEDHDYTTVENQKALMEFNEKLQNCDGCQEEWIKSSSFKSWYVKFRAYAQQMTADTSSACSEAWSSVDEVVTPSKYYACLDEFLNSMQGNSEKNNILMNKEGTAIVGFKQTIQAIYIESAANEGVKMLLDIRKITNGSGLQKTFSHSERYNDYESYVVFESEAILNITSALAAVLVLLLLFTANLTVTMMVLLCVGLVDLFLLSLLSFWGITLNSVTIVNCVIAIGLAVDYSAHIGHAYLTIDPPEEVDGKPLSDQEKRIFKARGALGAMGPSVFHGAFSTFLAIVVLSTSKSYIFTMFFRMWFGIIIFGVANGFIFLPVILSIAGPLNKVQNDYENNQVSDEDTEKKAIHEKQIELSEKQIN